MLRILRKTAASMAKTGGSGPAAYRCDISDDDLSVWEFVNSSMSDDEDVFSFDGDDVISNGDGATDDESDPEQEQEPQLMAEEGADEEEEEGKARTSRDCVKPKVIYSITCLSVSPRTVFPVEMMPGRVGDERDDDDDDDDEHGLDDYDIDDELVPWKLKNMLGKQRIRKMGKKGGPKHSKSKKLPYNHNRPGCLYGKHGFGVQHSFI
ncbi:uncharacterized protein LOC127262408 [Andrographis paniculata]|uniref:uncharacterized protein LOC127262408 n=1 Tax=Andrographis paniculata TaxID=175694 RepID=UPI0021E8CE2C|nr:uncharacterized protein LOC127262408 [Andrographis paniculata]